MEGTGEIKETMMVIRIEDQEDNQEQDITLDTAEGAIKEVDTKIKEDIKIKEEDIKIKETVGVIKIEVDTVVEKKLGIVIMKMRIKIIIKIVAIKIGEEGMIMFIIKREEAISRRVANRNIVRTSDLELPPVSKEITCLLQVRNQNKPTQIQQFT